MSKCLRLHCRCFKDLEYCRKNCKCTSCFNDEQHDSIRSFVIGKTRKINRQAFNSKLVRLESGEQTANVVNAGGCTCRTGCDRRYCECFKNGSGCSELCRCLDCRNQRLALPGSDIKRIYKPPARNKNKIIFGDLLTESQNLAVSVERTLPTSSENNVAETASELGDCSLPPLGRANLVVTYYNYKRVKVASTQL